MLHAGFWHQVREKIRAEHGDIGIICQSAAGGDLAPRQLHYLDAELRRYKLKFPEKYAELEAHPFPYPDGFFKTAEGTASWPSPRESLVVVVVFVQMGAEAEAHAQALL